MKNKSRLYSVMVASLALGLFSALMANVADAVTVQYDANCPISEKSPPVMSIDNDKDTPYVDDSREIKDFGTDIVVKEFFKTPDTLFNFLKLVYVNMDSAIRNYREQRGLEVNAIVFILKGGNVMRMMAKTFFELLPFQTRNLLEKEYGEFFKRSDADFSVIVDPNKLPDLSYERVMNDLTELTYKTLNKIRAEMAKRPEKYFNFMQLDNKFASETFRNYFGRLNELSALSDPNNQTWDKTEFLQLQLLDARANEHPFCRYQGENDYEFSFGKGKKNVIGRRLSNDSHWIMNTVNKSLEMPLELDPNKVIKFYLVRSKIQFDYIYSQDGEINRKPVGGELIDVSFPHKQDARFPEFIRNLNRYTANFTLRLDGTQERLNFKAESLAGIIDDLLGVIFSQNARPWLATKYEKRLNRVFFFSIMEMYATLGQGAPLAQEYLNTVLEKLLPSLSTFYSVKTRGEAQRVVESAYQTAKAITAKYPNMKNLNKFVFDLALIPGSLLKNPLEGDKDNFEKMFQLIIRNFQIMAELSRMKPFRIDIRDIYKINMKDFL